MKTFLIITYLLIQDCFSQNLVMTTDNRWMSVVNFIEEESLLKKQGILLQANGAMGIDSSTGKHVVVTASHVYEDISGAKTLGSDAICFPLKNIEQHKEGALPVGTWNPNQPVIIQSFIPHKRRVIEIEVYPKKTSLLDEVILNITIKRNTRKDVLGWEAYAEVSKDESGTNLFVPGVSGSPLIQDGKIVGVLSWILQESHGVYDDQIVGLSFFGHKPRSRTLVYSTTVLIPIITCFLLFIFVRFLVRKFKKK